MEKSAFISRFGAVFEHSPWVAEGAYDIWQAEQAATFSAEAVHTSMIRAFRKASLEDRLAVLKAHPDLAGKLAQAKRLTADSTAEQASAGLDILTDHERAEFTDLNNRYVDKFSFPFIIAVRDHNKASILSAFKDRINNNSSEELDMACQQVERIAYHRLQGMFDHDPS